MSFLTKVGTFAKSTGGAPASQAITGVGFQPKVLLMWTMGGVTDNTFVTQATATMRMAMGATVGTGASDSYSAAAAYSTGGIPAGRRSTAKAFMLTNDGTTAVAVAALTSFDSDGFTLSWTTNDAIATIIHYLALGGTEVQAKVLAWAVPTSSGNLSVTGAGFKPNAVLMFGSATAFDSSQTGTAGIRIGAAVSSSARWAQGTFGLGGASGTGVRGNFPAKAHVSCPPNSATLSVDADFVSFDADGITLNFATASGTHMCALCLNIPNVGVGTFTKPTGGAPVVGSVSVGFRPSIVLLTTVQKTNDPNMTMDGARAGIGAFTSTSAEAAAFSYPNNVTPNTYAGIDKTGKAILKLNNNTPSLEAEATAAITSSGFDLTWNGNDAVATEFNYLALGEFAPHGRGMGIKPPFRGANRPRLPVGAWRRRTN